MAWGRSPDPFSHLPLACAFQPIGCLLCSFPRHTACKEWWLGANLDLATEMISCCHCLSLIFTGDVWWIFVMVVTY